MIPFERILFLGAHPDDEFGCSGTLARFLEEEKELFFAVFSFCEESVCLEFPKDILRLELEKSLQTLGIKNENVTYYDFKVRRFPEFRQKILDILVALDRMIKPDLVLIPSPEDIHQDHRIIATEGTRAFKHRTILGYEFPFNMMRIQHDACFVRLEERHVDKKIEIMRCYKSQEHHYYSDEDYIRALAKVRGIQIKEKAAEMFEIIRFII